MRTQQRFFSQPFRKSYRHHNNPVIDYRRQKKHRQVMRAFRQQKTDGIKKTTLLKESAK